MALLISLLSSLQDRESPIHPSYNYTTTTITPTTAI